VTGFIASFTDEGGQHEESLSSIRTDGVDLKSERESPNQADQGSAPQGGEGKRCFFVGFWLKGDGEVRRRGGGSQKRGRGSAATVVAS